MGARTTPVESAQTLPARNGFEVTILPGSTSRFSAHNVVTPPKSRIESHPAKAMVARYTSALSGELAVKEFQRIWISN